MNRDRIIVRGEVTSPFQHIYVYKDGEKVDSVGIQFEDLAETVLQYLEKYNLNQIDLSGATLYMQGIEKAIKEAAVINYAGADFTFKYV